MGAAILPHVGLSPLYSSNLYLSLNPLHILARPSLSSPLHLISVSDKIMLFCLGWFQLLVATNKQNEIWKQRFSFGLPNWNIQEEFGFKHRVRGPQTRSSGSSSLPYILASFLCVLTSYSSSAAAPYGPLTPRPAIVWSLSQKSLQRSP